MQGVRRRFTVQGFGVCVEARCIASRLIARGLGIAKLSGFPITIPGTECYNINQSTQSYQSNQSHVLLLTAPLSYCVPLQSSILPAASSSYIKETEMEAKGGGGGRLRQGDSNKGKGRGGRKVASVISVTCDRPCHQHFCCFIASSQPGVLESTNPPNKTKQNQQGGGGKDTSNPFCLPQHTFTVAPATPNPKPSNLEKTHGRRGKEVMTHIIIGVAHAIAVIVIAPIIIVHLVQAHRRRVPLHAFPGFGDQGFRVSNVSGLGQTSRGLYKPFLLGIFSFKSPCLGIKVEGLGGSGLHT